jgi:hypothetical protein
LENKNLNLNFGPMIFCLFTPFLGWTSWRNKENIKHLQPAPAFLNAQELKTRAFVQFMLNVKKDMGTAWDIGVSVRSRDKLIQAPETKTCF